ncbi:hypothetical protein J5N97_005896 [Dioscorea zingiberensis]|uniref:DNA (cytosine-5-)-methyltransferase n=1 Tax=Dioscorea zingiberensis TaxID=325984 RepID=A0A9D5HSB3_9LILI|nr:hypothetical protein J5N97_005896 [Dioscorea zingiberensis]
MTTASAERKARMRKQAAEQPAGTPPVKRTRASLRAEAKENQSVSVIKAENGFVALDVVSNGDSAIKDPSAGAEGSGSEVVELPSNGKKRYTKKANKKEKMKEETVEMGNEGGIEATETDQNEDLVVQEESASVEGGEAEATDPPSKNKQRYTKSSKTEMDGDPECCFLGDPIPDMEAKEKWSHRYQKKEDLKARCHFSQAEVDGVLYSLDDCAYVKADEGQDSFICRIVEFFESTNRQKYFTAQWFYRAKDTVIKDSGYPHDPRRVFLSEDKNDNPLECIVSKIKIARVMPNTDLNKKETSIPECDLYYDMSYSTSYTSFANLPKDGLHSPISSVTSDSESSDSARKTSLTLLDLYSGCGAMSTGLCLGANFAGTDLQTRWAVDLNSFACESLKLNHKHTEVRNEDAENFLALLREWEQLCSRYSLIGTQSSFTNACSSDDEDNIEDSSEVPKGEFEVGKLVGICHGDPSKLGKVGLYFKVRWKGYGPSEDTWEPIDGLRKCQERIKDFVTNGYKRNILPLPGSADVICGGPPCQGISGFNRFRQYDAPLQDPKNKQVVVFMDIVEFLKPRYVLMENVVDLLKFARGFLGRYAVSRLVAMNYQARMGLMVAGCYGLPQFRMRVFLWGALPTEILPQFPYPTHDVVIRGGIPNEFEGNIVAYDESQMPALEKALLLEDAISDLPPVSNAEKRDEMPYGRGPITNFQRIIRLTKDELTGSQPVGGKSSKNAALFDHRPLELNDDDYQRVCAIPKRKGANFRDLTGVRVGEDNVVEWDPAIPRVYLPSGKPLVPDYCMSFIKGKSPKPFGRLWWDETVPTVVTRAEPHNQVILHPEQDRVLSIRENARLQGFPDYYQLRGPIKERYIQVGNAVAVPVSRALGVALSRAIARDRTGGSLFELPPGFHQHGHGLSPLNSVEVVGPATETM